MSLEQRLGRRFARVATNAVVRRPELWRLFRGPMRRQFERLAPQWDAIRMPGHLAAFEAALGAVTTTPSQALDLGTGTGQGAVAIARRFPDAHVVGVDLAPAMIGEAQAALPADVAGRIEFRQADASALPFGDALFELLGLANMIPFFDELDRVLAPGGWAVFGYSVGRETPIYVPPERLRAELGRRGFAEFAEFSEGRGTAFLARKRRRE